MIRVLRVLEYEFPDIKTMEISLAACAVPVNGTKVFGVNVIRSAIVTDFGSFEDPNAPRDS